MTQGPADGNAPPPWLSAWLGWLEGAVGPGTGGTSLAEMLSGLPSAASEDPAAAADQLREALADWQHRLTGRETTEQAVTQGLRAALDGHRLGLSHLLGIQRASVDAWPELGPLQADRARYEALLTAVEEHQSALFEFAGELITLIEAAGSAYRQECAPESDDPDPRRKLELWSRLAEAIYEQRLDDPEFSRRFAAVVNTGSKVRLRYQAILDPTLEALGLPSRRAVEDTQRHVVALERRLQREIERLETRIDGVRHAPESDT